MFGNSLRVLQLLIFSAFLAAPVAWLLAFGPAAPYEQKTQTDFPSIISVLSPDGQGRDQLADSIFERSDIRRVAISTKNSVLFDGLGFVDSTEVVSGAPGWLFYKPELAAWDCTNLPDNRNRIERIAFTAEIADAAKLPFLLVIAPNKATIETDKVRGRAASLVDCYYETSDLVEKRLAAANLSTILHHAPKVRKLGAMGTRFYATDTHWHSDVALHAFGDTLVRLGMRGIPDDFPVRLKSIEAATDLHRMLGITSGETKSAIDGEDPALRTLLTSTTAPTKTLVLRDSFYDVLDNLMPLALPGANILHVIRDRAAVDTAAPEADRILMEIVERSLLQQADANQLLAWSGPIGQWIVDRSDAVAGQCLWDQATDLLPVSEFKNLVLKADGTAVASTDDPMIISPGPVGSGQACIDLELESSQQTTAQIFLATADGSFVEERSVQKSIEPGKPTRLRLVLPASAAGKRLRIDPSSTAGELRLTALRMAPVPPAFRPLASGEGAPPSAQVPVQASVGPADMVVADRDSLSAFLIVPEKGDSGAKLADGSAYQARSKQKARVAVGDGDGVLLRLDAVAARRFSGRMVEVEVTARSAAERGSKMLRVMYSRSGAPQSSGWRDLPMTSAFEKRTFTYQVPVHPPASFDFIAFWADPSGNNLGVDIQSVKVRTVD